jgi:hypothetical protein
MGSYDRCPEGLDAILSRGIYRKINNLEDRESEDEEIDTNAGNKEEDLLPPANYSADPAYPSSEVKLNNQIISSN